MSRARDIANLLDSTGDVVSTALDNINVASDTTPQLGGNLDLNSSNITGTGDINTTGDITATGNLNVDGRDIVPLAKATDITSAGNWNNAEPNAIGYYYGGGLESNGGLFNNNGPFITLSSRFLDGDHDDTTDERAAQLYFGDTQTSLGGVHYRVRQGTHNGSPNWHPWARMLTSRSKGAVIQTAQDTNNSHTTTTSPSGFVALETALTPHHTSSRILVMATVYGSANDDSHAYLEYKIGTGSWTKDTYLNGDGTYGAALGDFSIIRSFSEPDQTVCASQTVMFHPNTTSEVRIRVNCTAENSNGFYLNIGTSQDATTNYNNNRMKSSLVIQEIAWE